MNILLVSGMYPSEGNPVYGTFIKRQVDELTRQGHHVDVVANTDSRTGAFHAMKKYAGLYRRATAAAKHKDYDVVVAHFLYPNAAIAHAAARTKNTPLVVVAHGTDVASVGRGDFLAEKSSAAIGAADGIVAVSRYLMSKLEDAVEVPAEIPRAIIHMGVDTNMFYPRSDARATLGYAPDERIVVVVGNLVEVKGPDRALDACIPLLRSGGLDRLVFVGDGTMRGDLASRVASEGLSDKVSFAGRCDSDTVAVYFSAATVALVPSRKEGLGLVILESLACGTPVIAAEVGGIGEILPQEPYGYRLDSTSSESWPDVIARALSNEKPTELLDLTSQSTQAKTAEFVDFLVSYGKS